MEAAFAAQLAGERGWWGELLAALEARAQYQRLAPEQQGQLLKNRGMWYVRHYSMEAALDSYRQALDLFRAVGSRLGEANTLKAIGFMKLDKGDRKAGLKALDEAMALYRQVSDRVGQVNTWWGLGIRLAQNGDLKEAESLMAQAVELGNQFAPGHPVTVHMESTLNQVRGRLDEQR